MTTGTDLTQRQCEPCNTNVPSLSEPEIQAHMTALDSAWQLSANHDSIERHYRVKGFAKAVYLANLAAWLADQEGHHPDISFGWGYCTLVFTTHDTHGLTLNDFICAQKMDKLTAQHD